MHRVLEAFKKCFGFIILLLKLEFRGGVVIQELEAVVPPISAHPLCVAFGEYKGFRVPRAGVGARSFRAWRWYVVVVGTRHGPGFKSRLNPFGFMKGSYPRDMILSVSDDICGIVNNYNGEDYHMHRRRAQKVRVSSKE
ncbi:MAG: hypothetical protein L6R35_004592 [Caloplaca aegaea]|nr:MAG: hypothetical protein L6R35_004592 [Caloplaca aegaea]